MLSALWGAIVAWDWHTYSPIVTTLAAGLMVLVTIVYTIGNLLLWSTTRRSVRAMEHIVKLTFLQMLYEAKKPSDISNPFRVGGSGDDLFRYGAELKYRQEYEAALRQVFPQLYGSVHVAEKATAPDERQEG